MNRNFRAALLLAVLPAAAFAQTTWYVDANGTPPGAGTQANPYTSLQHAIAQPATLSGDTVLVLPGTYLEQIDFLGKDLVVQSTAGAAGTVLDGNAAGPVVRFSTGETAAAVLDGFTVQNGNSVNVTYPDNPGGGIHCDAASPTLANLIVRSNHSLRGGGLRLLNGSAATLTDSVVRDNNLLISHGNVSESQGGGLWSSCDSTPVVTRVDFVHNERSTGGGVYGSGTFVECLFDDNNGFQGAGIYVPMACALVIHDSVIRGGNTCVDSDCGIGGGIYGPAQIYDSLIEDNVGADTGGGAFGATLTRCTISANRVFGIPGGTPASGGGTSNCQLVDCTVIGNIASGGTTFWPTRGGGVFGGTASRCRIEGNTARSAAAFHPAEGGGAHSATLVECEVVGNDVVDESAANPTKGGGAFGCTSSRTLFRGNTARVGGGTQGGSLLHCVVYENTATVAEGGVAVATTVRNSIVRENVPPTMTATTVTYSDVEGGFAGLGNFDADPLWWDAAGGDFHLRAGSPCIDAGDPTSPPDPDASIADVGIFPYDPTWAPGTALYCFGDAASCPCGNGGSGLGGCDLPQATGGVSLTIEDFAPDGLGGGTAKLVGMGYPPAASPTVIAIRSTAAESPAVVFGDGLRCIGTSGFARIGSTVAAGGVSERVITHGAGAGNFYYQLWFRSMPQSFCDANAAFNLSNGLEALWP